MDKMEQDFCVPLFICVGACVT